MPVTFPQPDNLVHLGLAWPLVRELATQIPSSGAGSGGFTIDLWTAGLTHTVTLTASQTITNATSATGGAKTANIPGATAGNSGYLWILKATLADGTSYTITPAFGTIDGASTYVFSDNAKDAVWLISDGVSNWGVV